MHSTPPRPQDAVSGSGGSNPTPPTSTVAPDPAPPSTSPVFSGSLTGQGTVKIYPSIELSGVTQDRDAVPALRARWDQVVAETQDRMVAVRNGKDGSWVYDHPTEGWIFYESRSDMVRKVKQRLSLLGWPKTIEVNSLKAWDHILLTVIETCCATFAGLIAGWPSGMHPAREISDGAVFITEGPQIVQPAEGAPKLIFDFLARILGSEPMQVERFLAWLKVSYEALRGKNGRPRIRQKPVLILGGEPGSGKSLLIDKVIVPLLGGRYADPYSYSTGQTSFNAHIFGAEVLVVDDKSASTTADAKRVFGDQIKSFAAVMKQSLHEKGKTPIPASPCWAFVMATNLDPQSIAALPDLHRDGLSDKMLVLYARKRGFPVPMKEDDEKDAAFAAIQAELPFLADFLLRWEIPEDIASERFRVAGWINADIQKAAAADGDGEAFLEIADRVLFKGADATWEGPVAKLWADLVLEVGEHRLPIAARSTQRLGILLKGLSETHPERVVRPDGKTRVDGSSVRVWRLNRSRVPL